MTAAGPGHATIRTARARACLTEWGTTARRPSVRRCLAIAARNALLRGVRLATADITWMKWGEVTTASRVMFTTRAAQGM